MSITIPREVRQILGVPNDPGAFAMAMFKQHTAKLRQLTTRALSRAGLNGQTITIDDADPSKAGKQQAKIVLRAESSPAKLGAVWATALTRYPKLGAVILDEAARMAIGLGQGPKAKMLDGGDVADIERLDPRTVQALAPRGLFGVDDAVIIGAGVTILVAAIPVVLPMLITWGKDAFTYVTSGQAQDDLSNLTGGIIPPSAPKQSKPTEPAPPPPDEGPPAWALAAVAVAVLGGAYALMR